MGVLVYQYGLMPPTTGADLVREQLRLAHRYRNSLTAAARACRSVQRELEQQSGMLPLLEDLGRASDVLADGVRALKAARVASRSKNDMNVMRATVAWLRERRKAAGLAVWSWRREHAEYLQAERDQINERWKAWRRGARALSGLRHGTYTLVEESLNQACDMLLWKDGSPNDPDFRRWRGDGTLGVQVQHGLFLCELRSGSDTRVQLLDVERSPDDTRRFGRNARSARTLRLRVGSNADRSPVWAEWQMICHRPLPPDAVIKRINATVRMVGPRERWTAEITVVTNDGARRERCGAGAVALDLGWRSVGDGYRIGMWVADDGGCGECQVPAEIRMAARKVDDLSSIRDRLRDQIRSRLVAWGKGDVVVPDWFAAATKGLWQWEQQRRFAGLLRTWEQNRFPGDKRPFTMLRGWAYRDRHLWCWEASQRSKMLGRRRDLYRRFAADLARRYDTLVIEDMNLQPLVERPVAEQEPTEQGDQRLDDCQRSNRQALSPHELRDSLIHAFDVRGGRVRGFEPAGSTYLCHRCGHDCAADKGWDPKRRLMWTCGGCGGPPWDQDLNAASNLLAWWCERPGDAIDVVRARKTKKNDDPEHIGETRRQRQARLLGEKQARMRTARNAAQNRA